MIDYILSAMSGVRRHVSKSIFHACPSHLKAGYSNIGDPSCSTKGPHWTGGLWPQILPLSLSRPPLPTIYLSPLGLPCALFPMPRSLQKLLRCPALSSPCPSIASCQILEFPRVSGLLRKPQTGNRSCCRRTCMCVFKAFKPFLHVSCKEIWPVPRALFLIRLSR